jgi:hypothetical protein
MSLKLMGRNKPSTGRYFKSVNNGANLKSKQ